MTSEGTQHPGQQPDEASPGAGGPTPYGDRPAQQDNGYAVGNPDLGWAPPPPARPNPAAPAWSTDVPPAPAWGATQMPQQTEASTPGAWAPDGGAPQWLAQSEQPARTETPEAPAWAQAEPAAPAWAQQGSAARGAAQVPQAAPAWPGQETPANPAAAQPEPTPGWSNGAAQPDPARTGGWAPANQPDGWATGTATRQDERPQQPDWATPQGGTGAQTDQPAWATPQGGTGAQTDQPAWAAPQADTATEQPAWAAPQTDTAAEQPAWAPEAAAPAWTPARGAAQVPGNATPPQAWPGQDDADRSTGQSTPDRSAAGWPGQPESGASGGWPAETAQEGRRHQDDPDGWGAGTADDHRQQPQFPAQQDDSARSGGWPSRTDDQPQPEWTSSVDRDAAAQPHTDAWPSNDAQPNGDWAGRAAAPTGDGGAWHPGEPAAPAARASASVPGDAPQPWVPAQRSSADRPAVPNVEPWAPGEAWGHTEPSADAAREPERVEEPAVYQPAPAPGISPDNALPLPPQEQRVPGASLAADPPASYQPPTQFAPEQPARDDAAPAYEAEPQGWAPAARHDESPAAPVVPAPRTSPESAGRASVPAATGGASGSVSASASVPMASRVTPPSDQALPPTTPAPQPRVYGRPTRPEPAEDAGAPNAHPADQRGFGPDAQPEHGPDNGFGADNGLGHGGGERPAGPAAFGGAAPVAPASPAPPPFPQGVPAFADAPANDRPVNGTRPQPGAERPADHFGAPATGAASVNGSGFPPPPEPAFPPAFPPSAQPAMPSWDQSGHGGQAVPEPEQGRFEAFKPIAEPAADTPTPKVRNGRVLAAVLVAAVLILTIPLGLLLLLGKVGGDDNSAPTFDPALGSCVKQEGTGAAEVDCGAEGAFTVVSKVDAKEKCADPAQPHVVLPGEGSNRVLCLKPAS